MNARRPLLCCLLLLGCDRDELEFSLALADAGLQDADVVDGQAARVGIGATGSDGDALGFGDHWRQRGESFTGLDRSEPSRRPNDPAGALVEGLLPDEAFDTDPNGTPAGPEQQPRWCGTEERHEEICGSGVDEDCDGTVDEFAQIGLPCEAGCGHGQYACLLETNTLVCRGLHGCATEEGRCGNGVVDEGEQCDFAAPGERLGITCERICRRPLFVQCLGRPAHDPDGPLSPIEDICNELATCTAWVGACMPVIGPQQPRCPELAVEQQDDDRGVYPMIEVEVPSDPNGEEVRRECWVTCAEAAQCPASLPECYMGFCVVAL